MPRPSRSHCTTAPPTNTLPSSAKMAARPRVHAAVVSNLLRDALAWMPVFMSMKQPVPYVFLTMPGEKQHWPNRAAC